MAAIPPGQPGPYLEPRLGPRPASDSDSDSDSDSGSPASGRAQPGTGFPAHSQVIHSGHFMVSSPHSDAASRRRHHLAESPSAAPPSIDPTLTRLFECMSLAYSGKLVSPKWKNFKGLRLLCRDKIRLNNAIWRAWYIQYVARRRSPVCGFVTPLDGSEADDHRKPQAVVLEGNYWKRRIEVVMKEYHKWRTYHKKKLHRFSQEEEAPGPRLEEEGWGRTDHWCDQLFCNVVPMLLGDKEEEEERRQLFDVGTFLSDISDTLFTMTQGSGPSQPSPEDAYAGNADMIQPDLTPLQPNLDDFMEISDFFPSPRALPAQTPLSRQEPPCFGPGPETLFGSSDGTLLPGPEDGLLPPGPPVSPGSSGPRLQAAGGGSTALHPPGAFLSPGLPAAPVAPAAPGLEGKPKPLPPYSCPSKWFSPEHCGPYAPLPLPLPSPDPDPAPALAPAPAPACHLAPPPRPRLLPSPLLCPVPPTPCFPQDSPGYSMALPPGYLPHPHFNAPTLPPAGTTGPIRAAVRPESDGLWAKGVGGKAKRAPRSTASLHGAHPNPCLAQLLTPAKVEPSPEAEPAPSAAPLPACLESLPNAFFAESSSFVPRMSQPSPGLSPVSSPPPALLVPKAERLSPTPACARSRQTGSLQGPAPTSHFACGWSRTEPSKVESRRITHISAEQKRRFNIKVGFDTLHSLVSTLSTQPSQKVSKATTLQKTSEYICKLQQERAALQEEAQRLRDQIEELNTAVNLCQQQLPATGVPITRQRFDQMRAMFDEYVRSCTLRNWKFWVFSILMRPLFESFSGMVSTASLESLSETSLAWLEQCCSLPALRPAVLSSLRQLSISTSILTNPADVPEQATQAVTGAAPNSGST